MFFSSSLHFNGPPVSHGLGFRVHSLGIFYSFLFTVYLSYTAVCTAFLHLLTFSEYWLPLGGKNKEVGQY